MPSGVDGNLSQVSSPDSFPLSFPAEPFGEIAGYRLRKILGAGSFAQTFLAEKNGRLFALKMLKELPMGTEAVRFEREVDALKLAHPSLINYVESGIGRYGGLERAYIVMPYLPGRTLKEAIDGSKGPPLSIERICEVAATVADGLAFIHDHNVTHQDLNPKNIFLTDDGQALILDFGLAKFHDRATITLEGHAVGTPAYLAPEQLRGDVDLASDFYALGATLYYCLTGRPPFEGHLMALMKMIEVEDPEPPSSHDPELDPLLDDLVLKLMAKEPLQRPSNARAVADRLREPHRPNPAPVPYRRDSAPLLAVRATMSQASRAILDTAMTGGVPDFAIAALTVPNVLGELVRAAGLLPELGLLVDTRVNDTTSLSMPKAIRERAYAPPEGHGPYTDKDFRDPQTCKRVARGDLKEQDEAGGSAFRSVGFTFAAPEDDWLKRNARLQSDALQARGAFNANAPMFATIRCDIDALNLRDNRIAIANRYARGNPNGFWVELYGLSATALPEVIAAAFDFLLLLQERGVPVVAALPGSLVELAWSIGIGGVEVKLGRQGTVSRTTNRAPVRADASPRFEFPSIFDSMPRSVTLELLDHGLLPESQCDCPSCRLASSLSGRADAACDHSLAMFLDLRRTLSGLDVDQRLERLVGRFDEAEAHLGDVRVVLKSQRFSTSVIRKLRRTLDALRDAGTLRPVGRLQRSA
jgi:predicted Ser/Thr protein kinase